MKLYVSGPMTGLPEHNFPAFQAAAAKLRALGYEVIDPSDKGIIEGWEWEDYLRWDLDALLKCDALAMLPSWIHSRGANLEVHVAKALGMRVLPVDYWVADASKQTHPFTKRNANELKEVLDGEEG